jgi:MFS family permease
MGLYSGIAIFAQPVVGVWVDRVGRRPFMLGGAALAAMGALGFALAPTALGLFPLLRIVQGLAYSLFFIANFTLVIDLVPAQRRGQALGIFGISGLTSTAVGPALGELVVRTFGFRTFFAAAGVVSLTALAVAARVQEPSSGRPATAAGLSGLLHAVLTTPRLPMALAFGFGLGLGVVFTFLPTYAETVGVRRIGLFAVAYSAGALVVRAAGGELIDRVGRRPVIIPALGLQAAGAVLLAGLGPLVARAGWPAGPLLGLVGLLAGAAHGFLYPALTALVMDLTPEDRRGRVIGVFGAYILAGHSAGAMLFGYLAHAAGYSVMFGVLAVGLAATCALAFRLPPG